MEKWFGAAGICLNDNSELLMVLQGKPEEKKKRGLFHREEKNTKKHSKSAV